MKALELVLVERILTEFDLELPKMTAFGRSRRR
jgi:hypothetical protein